MHGAICRRGKWIVFGYDQRSCILSGASSELQEIKFIIYIIYHRIAICKILKIQFNSEQESRWSSYTDKKSRYW